jgi:hypothetical protein
MRYFIKKNLSTQPPNNVAVGMYGSRITMLPSIQNKFSEFCFEHFYT